ncbi:hypothetical protein FNV43_RR09739 [Rhamnella rubrinervis]|uniref:Uncharacterized protein n=1 Tax=Rhamnella rubrinervis TaxID=2594499 RepID=A0A8K0MKN0_9ROSA|nr:hypothetical protein FNV43_RR09739 [Rhamnella rubrinervis]
MVSVMVPRVHEMSLIATVHHAGSRKLSDATLVVEDKPNVNLDADKVHLVPDKTSAKKSDAVKRVRRHSSPSAYTPAASARQSSPIASPVGAVTPDAYNQHSSLSPHTSTESKSVDIRLCAMEEKLSSMDSRLSSMDSKLDCLIKLFTSTYNTTRLDEDDDQCFNEVRGEDVGVSDAHKMCDQRIDHTANNLVPPMSISSSLNAEFKHKVKHIETVAQLTRQHADKYLEVFDDRIFLLDNGLSILLPLNRDNNYWLLGDIDLCAQHMMLYDCRKHGQISIVSNSMNEFGISLAPDYPQQKTE